MNCFALVSFPCIYHPYGAYARIDVFVIWKSKYLVKVEGTNGREKKNEHKTWVGYRVRWLLLLLSFAGTIVEID